MNEAGDDARRNFHFEHFLPMGSLVNVKLAKMVWIGLLVLVWAAASNHCRLEQIPGFAFLACCDHEDAVPHEDDDCEKDACATFENQLYKTDHAPVSVGKPVFLFTDWLDGSGSESSTLSSFNSVSSGTSPAHLPRVWQFIFRTALPPRAPSFAS